MRNSPGAEHELPHTIPGFVWHFAKLQKWKFLALLVLIMADGIQYSFWPYLNKLVVDAFSAYLAAGAGEARLLYALGPVIALYFGMKLLGMAIFRTIKAVQGRAYPKLKTAIRLTMIARTESQPYSFFANHFAGNLMNKINDLGSAAGDIIKRSYDTLFIVLFILASFALFLTAHWAFVVIASVWIVIQLSLCAWRMKAWNRMSFRTSEAHNIATGHAVDSITSYSSVKAFAGEKLEIRFLKPFYLDKEKKNVKECLVVNRDWIVFTLIGLAVLYAPAVYMICRLFPAGAMSVGDVVFVLTCLERIHERIFSLSDKLADFSEQWGIMDQAMWIATSPVSIKDAKGARPLRVSGAAIEFRNTAFKYEWRRTALFRNFSLDVAPGEKLGIVGQSGSGKSSIMHLLLRYFDVNAGAILIDGQDIRKVTQESLHRQIAFVSQDTALFHRSILDNIRYGRPDATEAEIFAAAKKAYVHGIIMAMPDKYDSPAGDRGSNLSGGQRQRVAIARAILKDSPILLLDEATSALDSETELEIQKSLEALMRERTTIAIAHRLSTLRNMDRIIVLSKGRIAEEGSHRSLLAKKGLYARFWSMQSGGFIGH